MSFFDDIKGNGEFSDNASNSLRRALNVLNNTVSTGATPYYNFTSHVKSVAHPFVHATQLLRNAARLTYGAFVFAGALLSLNGGSAARTLGDMISIALASVLEIVNVVCSIVSFVTRTVASIFSLGYTSAQINRAGSQLNGRECGGRNTETTMNMFAGIALGLGNQMASNQDDIVNQSALSLI